MPIPQPDGAEDDLEGDSADACGFDAREWMDFVPEGLEVASGDPRRGRFTLRDATRGLSGSGALLAIIDTDWGALECELWHERAPYTVANFVGLARGLRPFRDPDTKRWQTRPVYDGSSFHRIVAGFMIQGGDPTGTGQGAPGYVIPDEIWDGALHDRRGLLCMANRGPNTNGFQFFILDGPAPHLDGSHTIFGSCGPARVIEQLASVPVEFRNRPRIPLRIHSVTIELEHPCGDATTPVRDSGGLPI